MEGGGLLTLIAMLILSPYQFWNERVRQFDALTPVEQQLQRVSHGFALMFLAAKVPIRLFGAKQVFAFFPALVTAPREAAWGLPFLVAFTLGLVRFLVGYRRYWTMPIHDFMLASRAFWCMAAGFAGVKLLVPYLQNTFEPTGLFWSVGLLGVLTVSYWWLLTGAVRFVLLTIGGSNALRKLLIHLKDKNTRRKPGKPTR